MMIFFISCKENEQEQYSKEVYTYVKNSLLKNISTDAIFGVGRPYSKNMDYRQSYIEALKAAHYAEIIKAEYVHIDNVNKNIPKPVVDIAGWSKKLFEDVWVSDTSYALDRVDNFINRLSAVYEGDFGEIKDNVYQVMVLLDNALKDMFGEGLSNEVNISLLEEVNHLSDLKGLKLWMLNGIRHIIKIINDNHIGGSVNSIIIAAMEYINKNYTGGITLDSLAENLNISPFYLSKILKKHTGKNYTDLIAELRINKAKELLIKTDMSIKEITYATGFNSQNYFTKNFKKIVGLTPTEYKNIRHEKNI